jgi:transposase
MPLMPATATCPSSVMLDNLSTHKIRGIREAIEAAGARLLDQPPYSPDFLRSVRRECE